MLQEELLAERVLRHPLVSHTLVWYDDVVFVRLLLINSSELIMKSQIGAQSYWHGIVLV